MLFCVIVILTVVLALATGGKSIAPTNLLDLVTSYSAYGACSSSQPVLPETNFTSALKAFI